MNPGPVEEGAKVADNFLDAMKTQPLSLALVVMNFGLLGYLFWSGHELMQLREHTAQMIVSWQTETGKLLANCVPLRDMEELLKTLGVRPREPAPGDPK